MFSHPYWLFTLGPLSCDQKHVTLLVGGNDFYGLSFVDTVDVLFSLPQNPGQIYSLDNVIDPVPEAIFRTTATQISSSEILVCGINFFTEVYRCYKLDITTGEWISIASPLPDPTFGNYGFSQLLFVNNNSIASHGNNDTVLLLGQSQQVYYLDLEQEAWNKLTEWEFDDPAEGRCVLPVDNTLYSLGGKANPYEVLRLDSVGQDVKRWTILDDMPRPRIGHACLLVRGEDGMQRIVLTGGVEDQTDQGLFPPLIKEVDWLKIDDQGNLAWETGPESSLVNIQFDHQMVNLGGEMPAVIGIFAQITEYFK